MDNAQIIHALGEIVGNKHVLTDPLATRPYRKGIRYGEGDALAVVQPRSLWEMWQVAQLIVKEDCILIMQASNTGLTGGSSPWEEYERPVVIISTRRLKGLKLIKDDQQALAYPGDSLYELEDLLRAHGREPHSVIGSSCIGASIVGGICNNSGGALIHRGPAYTELSLFARRDENGVLTLHNHLGIDLGDTPETILKRLDSGDFSAADVHGENKNASDHEYQKRIRDVDADSPSRFNNDPRRLYEAAGSAGRVLVFAVRVDTFMKPKKEQVFYIGTNNPDRLTEIRRHILSQFENLPISGEYMHRDCFTIAERYGRDTFLVINKFGSGYIPKFFAMKNRFDQWTSRLFPKAQFMSDRIMQRLTDLLPSHLPKFMRDYHQRYEHHLILKMADGGIVEAENFLSNFFSDKNDGDVYHCNAKEAAAAQLHRFAAAGAANRLHAVSYKKSGELMALDIALKRNERHWFEVLPPELDKYMQGKYYYGHFFCHVMHQDYILKQGTDADAVHEELLAYEASRGAEYPAEHNVGHLYHAKEALVNFYKQSDPGNRFNPGIGKTSKKKNWA